MAQENTSWALNEEAHLVEEEEEECGEERRRRRGNREEEKADKTYSQGIVGIELSFNV